jgi:hypothetical protein
MTQGTRTRSSVPGRRFHLRSTSVTWSRRTVLVVVAVVLALAGAVWALGDPAPAPMGTNPLAAPTRPVVLPTPAPGDGLSTPRAAPDRAVEIAPGVTLLPGADGTLPVTVRWVRRLNSPEQVAVDGDTVYAADVAFDAYDVADGTLSWRVFEPSGEGFDADGAVEIGTPGPDRVEVWAPWNYDLTVARQTGEIVRLQAEPVRGLPLRPLPAPRPTAFRVDAGLPDVVARYPGGAVAWRISVEHPTVDPIAPIAVPGGLLVVAASGDLVALDVPASS